MRFDLRSVRVSILIAILFTCGQVQGSGNSIGSQLTRFSPGVRSCQALVSGVAARVLSNRKLDVNWKSQPPVKPIEGARGIAARGFAKSQVAVRDHAGAAQTYLRLGDYHRAGEQFVRAGDLDSAERALELGFVRSIQKLDPKMGDPKRKKFRRNQKKLALRQLDPKTRSSKLYRRPEHRDTEWTPLLGELEEVFSRAYAQGHENTVLALFTELSRRPELVNELRQTHGLGQIDLLKTASRRFSRKESDISWVFPDGVDLNLGYRSSYNVDLGTDEHFRFDSESESLLHAVKVAKNYGLDVKLTKDLKFSALSIEAGGRKYPSDLIGTDHHRVWFNLQPGTIHADPNMELEVFMAVPPDRIAPKLKELTEAAVAHGAIRMDLPVYGSGVSDSIYWPSFRFLDAKQARSFSKQASKIVDELGVDYQYPALLDSVAPGTYLYQRIRGQAGSRDRNARGIIDALEFCLPDLEPLCVFGFYKSKGLPMNLGGRPRSTTRRNPAAASETDPRRTR